MTKITNLVFFLLLSISLSTCIDPIDFEEASAAEHVISIQGRLTKGNPSQVRVLLRNTFYFTNNPRFIAAKSVEIIDQEGNVLALATRQQGVYEIEIPDNHPTFKIDYGKAYKINIEFLNEKIYESNYDTLYAVPEPTALNVRKLQQEIINNKGEAEIEYLLSFAISTPLSRPINSKKSYFLWELESVFKQSDTPTIRAGCIVPSCLKTSEASKTCFQTISPVKNYKVLDANSLSGDYIEAFTIFDDNAMSGTYAEGYYLTVYQQSLSQAAYEYWSKVNLIVNRTGSQFEGPVGNIPSNISSLTNPTEEVHGYFFSTESSLKRVYVSPNLAGNPRRTCPPPPTDNSPSGKLAICCNCLCQPNSSMTKPDWWVE